MYRKLLIYGGLNIVDISNCMIYSIEGIDYNGIRVYSLNMYNKIHGSEIVPDFEVAEVSINKDKALVNKTRYKIDNMGSYIYDEDGELIENEKYDNNGFQIIANYDNKNIYKLYNNGDLYGKGIKGYCLNSSQKEIDEIDSTIWSEFKIPSEIPGAEDGTAKIYPGFNQIFVVDKNKDLWGWGSNDYNMFGLSSTEQVSFSKYEIYKLNVNGKKVEKVFPREKSVFVLTKDNEKYELYVCGYNKYGELGIGNYNEMQYSFSFVEFENPEKITDITDCYRDMIAIYILKEGKLYVAGGGYTSKFALLTKSCLNNIEVKKIASIFNENGNSFILLIMELYLVLGIRLVLELEKMRG